MVRVRVPVRGLSSGRCALDRKTAHYVTHVLRLGVDAVFVAFDPDARVEADARVVAVSPSAADVEVGAVRVAPVLARREVTWIHGLPKGSKADAIVRDVTELGATRVVFAETTRAVRVLDALRRGKAIARWNEIAIEAARQSGRGDAPSIDLVSWQDALLSVVGDVARFCPFEGAEAPLGAELGPVLADPARALAFAVGPEGGLTEGEASVAEASGYRLVSLGSAILRTETVPAAILGAVLIAPTRA